VLTVSASGATGADAAALNSEPAARVKGTNLGSRAAGVSCAIRKAVSNRTIKISASIVVTFSLGPIQHLALLKIPSIRGSRCDEQHK